MAERNNSQLGWEQDYLSKVKRINEIIHNEKLSLLQLRSNPVISAFDKVGNAASGWTDKLMAGAKSLFSGNAGSSAVAGTFSLPSTIKVATISGSKVTIPTGVRTPYHKARDLAAKESGFSGFQAINEDMYNFSYPEQNMFAPDFIPILAMMHSKIAPALGRDKVTISSGTRKEPIDVEWDAHMGGYAVDISLTGKDRYTAADICWEMGLRGVAVGNSFVHVDAGPDPVSGWGYSGVPIYRGPTSPR